MLRGEKPIDNDFLSGFTKKSVRFCEESLLRMISSFSRFPPPIEPGVTPVSKGTIEIRSVWVPKVR